MYIDHLIIIALHYTLTFAKICAETLSGNHSPSLYRGGAYIVTYIETLRHTSLGTKKEDPRSYRARASFLQKLFLHTGLLDLH